MGFYLNGTMAYTLYENEAKRPYFVDKSRMLEELFTQMSEGNTYICLTRPRRFGKTIMANMIVSFFSKACSSRSLFNRLVIAKAKEYEHFLGRYNVVHISFNDFPRDCRSYEQYIRRIENILAKDLAREFPDVNFEPKDALWDMFMTLYMEHPEVSFLFVLDEWDFIFHQEFVTEEDKRAYLIFLRSLLKDRPYVKLAYMTGILPIAKYSSGSELNMFVEYTMARSRLFSEYFGFSDAEVDMLYERYRKRQTSSPRISREALRWWYDGYATPSGMRLYNPRSVVLALSSNSLDDYWTSSGRTERCPFPIKS